MAFQRYNRPVFALALEGAIRELLQLIVLVRGLFVAAAEVLLQAHCDESWQRFDEPVSIAEKLRSIVDAQKGL